MGFHLHRQLYLSFTSAGPLALRAHQANARPYTQSARRPAIAAAATAAAATVTAATAAAATVPAVVQRHSHTEA